MDKLIMNRQCTLWQKKGQEDRRLCLEKHRKQEEGSGPSLPPNGEATSGVLCPALGFPV